MPPQFPRRVGLKEHAVALVVERVEDDGNAFVLDDICICLLSLDWQDLCKKFQSALDGIFVFSYNTHDRRLCLLACPGESSELACLSDGTVDGMYSRFTDH